MKRPNQFNTPQPLLEPSLELSYILGVLEGDGCVYKTKTAYGHEHIIQLCVKDKKFLEEFNRCLGKVFSRTVKIIYCKSGLYKICLRSKAFYEWYYNLTAEELSRISLTHPNAFIKGFYDSEGSLTKFTTKKGEKTYTTYCVRMLNSNLQLLENIKSVMERTYGIRSKIAFRKPHQTVIDGRVCNFKENLYVLGIYNKGGVERFLKNVGSSIPRKTMGVDNNG
ncbi:MAG: LAGLIDADG family homing endonuclease [Candidatus Aenigmatarchaeota archaeon]